MRLGDNGLRQGCALSPILYLVIMDTLRSGKPDTKMPEWDAGCIDKAFSYGFQSTEEDTLRSIQILIFVDDTILIGRGKEEMQKIMDTYMRFTKIWRIRVNPGKCAVIPMTKHCDAQYNDELAGKQFSEWEMAGQKVQIKKKHKYLGIVLSGDTSHKAFMRERDAMVIQMKQKIRSVREALGESIALEYVDSIAMPKITYGAELVNVKAEKLMSWQTQLQAVALGIGRKEQYEGHPGVEPAKVFIRRETERRLWGHQVGMNAWRMLRATRGTHGYITRKNHD